MKKTLILAICFLYGNIDAQFLINQEFTGNSVAGITIQGNAKLTAASGIDPNGNGWLRLTEDTNNQTGYAYVQESFPSSMGVFVEFEYKTWRTRQDPKGYEAGNYNGADGFSIFLFDAQYGDNANGTSGTTFSTGAYGGSLGYAQSTGLNVGGLTGGYIGIGWDEFGSFATTQNKYGGIPSGNFRPNAITLRGETTSNISTSNPFLKGVSIKPDGSITDVLSSYAGNTMDDVIDYNTITSLRPTQTQFYRKVRVTVTPLADGKYNIKIYWTKDINSPYTELINYDTASVPPALLKVGFAASTGSGINKHEIRNLKIMNVGDLAVTKQANVPSLATGGTIEYTIPVQNDSNFTSNNIGFTDQLRDGAGNPLTAGVFSITSITADGFTSASLPTPSLAAPITSGSFSGMLSLAANTTGTIKVIGKLLSAPDGKALQNSASLSIPSDVTDNKSENNQATVMTQITDSFCYKSAPPTGAPVLDTRLGITALGRSGVDDKDNWPMVKKGGWIALESKSKAFVPNRISFYDADNNSITPDVPVGIDTKNFVEGMVVYDTTNKCMKVYTQKEGDSSMAWHCISTQACPD